jgi:hypothetical protein
VEVPYFLREYDPDALHFYLTATTPETRDAEFSWEDFVERNNWVLSVNEGTSWSPPGATWRPEVEATQDGHAPFLQNWPKEPRAKSTYKHYITRQISCQSRGCVVKRCGHQRRSTKRLTRGRSRCTISLGERRGAGTDNGEPCAASGGGNDDCGYPSRRGDPFL